MKSYPFTPKSNKFLEEGDFWIVKLKNKHYAAGVVLHSDSVILHSDTKELGTKGLYVGLLNWTGTKVPTSKELSGKRVIEVGRAHIKTITETGGQILGNCKIKKPAVLGNRDEVHGWGYTVIVILAEKHFGTK